MNSALPSPQPARNPTMPSTTVDGPGQPGEHHDQHQAEDQCPLGADPAGDPADPDHRHGGHHEIAGEQQRHLAGVAASSSASTGRIGSTSPMPMNDTTHANATAHTARGCLNGLAAAAPWWELHSSCLFSDVGFVRVAGRPARQESSTASTSRSIAGSAAAMAARSPAETRARAASSTPARCPRLVSRTSRPASVTSMRTARLSASSATRASIPCWVSRLTSCVIAGWDTPATSRQVGDPLRPRPRQPGQHRGRRRRHVPSGRHLPHQSHHLLEGERQVTSGGRCRAHPRNITYLCYAFRADHLSHPSQRTGNACTSPALHCPRSAGIPG